MDHEIPIGQAVEIMAKAREVAVLGQIQAPLQQLINAIGQVAAEIQQSAKTIASFTGIDLGKFDFPNGFKADDRGLVVIRVPDEESAEDGEDT